MAKSKRRLGRAKKTDEAKRRVVPCSEAKRNRFAWEATERFLSSGIEIKDVYRSLDRGPIAQPLFGLSAAQWKAFLEALDAPPRSLPRLKRLLKEHGFFDADTRRK